MKVAQFISFTKTLGQYMSLVTELVLRDLKLKYRRSFLGYLWSLLNPLMMMSVMTLVFSYMFRFDIPNYPLYLICGQTLWAFLNESTTLSMHSIIQNGALIRKVYIPKYIFPMARTISCFVTMTFSMTAILLVMLFTRIPFTPALLLAPIPLLLLMIFCMGIGMAVSSMAVYFRDILHLYSVMITAWMYLTPIFYPVSALPERIAWIVKLNPMYHYITLFRELVLYGSVPSPGAWITCFLISISVFLVGALIFRKLQRNFILYV